MVGGLECVDAYLEKCWPTDFIAVVGTLTKERDFSAKQVIFSFLRKFRPNLYAYASGSGCTLVNARAIPNFPSVNC